MFIGWKYSKIFSFSYHEHNGLQNIFAFLTMYLCNKKYIQKYSLNNNSRFWLCAGHCEKPAICPIHTADVPFWYYYDCVCIEEFVHVWSRFNVVEVGYKGHDHIMVWKYWTNYFVHLHFDDLPYKRSDVFAICL